MHIMLVTHGMFCQGILNSYQMIAGINEKIQAISLTDEGIGTFTQIFQQKMDELSEKEVLVITDIKGGTPYNEALNYYLNHSERVRVVAGLNLPMLIEAGLAMETSTLDVLYELALTTGKAGVAGIDADDSEDDIEF
ncbi:PTS sugar transporter subunit IIA [Candidatus Enterococcus ferrettii]|uniref:PTS EIIA type-4 domain-containing protein n=1 Tax=Candidatus Enterococcus ferrettii TaxID=2815324 RepID=A0ABV0EVR3_9ENTE|nr:PTS mannose/fructose/sorbose family IIA subunit [Enterococcus sp. 665A]